MLVTLSCCSYSQICSSCAMNLVRGDVDGKNNGEEDGTAAFSREYGEAISKTDKDKSDSNKEDDDVGEGSGSDNKNGDGVDDGSNGGTANNAIEGTANDDATGRVGTHLCPECGEAVERFFAVFADGSGRALPARFPRGHRHPRLHELFHGDAYWEASGYTSSSTESFEEMY